MYAIRSYYGQRSCIAWLDTASRGPSLRSVLVAEYRAREASNLDPALYREEQLSAEGAARRFGCTVLYLGGGGNEHLSAIVLPEELLNKDQRNNFV